MFFSLDGRWNQLSEGNAGILKAREIAEGLGTNITVVRNMAERKKLSLRGRGYAHERVERVRELYAAYYHHVACLLTARAKGVIQRSSQMLLAAHLVMLLGGLCEW